VGKFLDDRDELVSRHGFLYLVDAIGAEDHCLIVARYLMVETVIEPVGHCLDIEQDIRISASEAVHGLVIAGPEGVDDCGYRIMGHR